MKRTYTIAVLLLLLSGLQKTGHSQDRSFTYTYESGVLAKGNFELEAYTSLRSGRHNFYRALDQRLEFEIGLAKNLQTAFYLNFGNKAYYGTQNVLIESGGVFVPSMDTSILEEVSLGFSNEWKWKLSDPVANTIGSALYFELGLSPREIETEVKLILDKSLGRSLHAVNLTLEPGWEVETEAGKTVSEFGMDIKINYALSYTLRDHWSLHMEVMNVNRYTKPEDKLKLSTSTLFGGPGFSYHEDRFWLNFTCLPQIAAIKHENASENGLNLNNHEKFQTRLIFSYAF